MRHVKNIKLFEDIEGSGDINSKKAYQQVVDSLNNSIEAAENVLETLDYEKYSKNPFLYREIMSSANNFIHRSNYNTGNRGNFPPSIKRGEMN